MSGLELRFWPRLGYDNKKILGKVVNKSAQTSVTTKLDQKVRKFEEKDPVQQKCLTKNRCFMMKPSSDTQILAQDWIGQKSSALHFLLKSNQDKTQQIDAEIYREMTNTRMHEPLSRHNSTN